MFTHLGWSLLGVTRKYDPLSSADLPSVILARFLYAAFLVLAVVLLINMLIALLSNTYQRTEDNSRKEWSFKRAVSIQTYDDYDPIPVPLNIIYRLFIMLLRLVKRKVKTKKPSALEKHVEDLEERYFAEHANFFPVTDEKKLDLVLQETERNRQMVSQILSTTFEYHGGTGVRANPVIEDTPDRANFSQKNWQLNPGIRREGSLLTCEGAETCHPTRNHYHGARYCLCLSPEMPHFDVTVIETGKKRWLGIGVVHEDYNTKDMPGWYDGSVGYHTDDGKIFHNDNSSGQKTKGPVMARRGDRIRCTVMFENKREKSGKVQVPVVFSLNGKKVVIQDGEGQFFVDDDKPLFPYVGMTDGSSVLAKMCAREDMFSKGEVLDQVLQIKENLEDIVSREVNKATRNLEKKFDALLAKLGEKK